MQKRLEHSIEKWHKHLGQVKQIRKRKKVNNKVRAELERKYQLTERETESLTTFLKNKIQTGSSKIGDRPICSVTTRSSCVHSSDAKSSTDEPPDEPPDATKSWEFWSEIWSV